MASDHLPPCSILQEEEEEEDDDSDTDNDSSSSLPIATPIPIPIPIPPPIIAPIKKQIDESRKLFQRLWTDEDEIELLQGYLDYTSQRNTNTHGSHHHDTSAFYDGIRSKFQLDFNKNQLVEKLRRLKKKYRNVVNKVGSGGKEYVFKTPHDEATFHISSRIWGNSVGIGVGVGAVAAAVVENEEEGDQDDIDMNSKFTRTRKRSRVKVEEEKMATTGVGVGSISGVIEETVKSCLTPIFKELLGNMVNGNVNGNGVGLMQLGGFGSIGGEKIGDGRWRKQQILELEVFSKRLELMQDEVNEKLQELRSMGD